MLKLEGRPIATGTGHDAGRALLKEMVEAHTGLPMPSVAVTDRGKPYFPGSKLHFSISHTDRHVFCALSDRPIGIDAEELDRDIPLKLAQKILSPGETARFSAAKDPRLALLRLWVLKEAAAKATGQGLRGYPRHTDLSPEDPRIQIMDGCLVAVIQEDDYAL